jgi:glycosyltransferase involved in cell wall biosynthesis
VTTEGALPLSVIITVFNGRAHVARQLEKVAEQNPPWAWEVIVVDNGSSDGSQDVVATFSDQLPNFRLLHEDRRGKAYALNRGIAEARGERLVLLDHDDEIAAGYLEAMEKALRQFDLVGARVDRVSINPSWARYQGGQTDGLCKKKGCPDFSIGAALGARAAVARAVGFDPSVGASEDIDFCWRAQERGYRLGFVPDALLHYRQRDTEKAAFKQGYAYGRAEVKMYIRYRDRGHPRHGPRVVLWTLKSLAGLALHSAQRPKRLFLCYWSGIVAGNLAGSVRGRVLYL